MTWPGMMTPWAPAPADPLRLTILAALATVALDCRDTECCTDCRDGELCPDHRQAAALAGRYEAAYLQVAVGSADWCDLAVKLISEMN